VHRRLVVGLGNPGLGYRATRHNMGYEVVKKIAKQQHWSFKRERGLEGKVARGKMHEKELILLLPLTYMNKSGVAVERSLEEFHVSLENLLVIVDDTALSFGKLRFRKTGSSGGHNGLKSIEAHLRTDHYPRLRIGIGACTGSDLAAYVLGPFSREEKGCLPEIQERAIEAVDLWLKKGIDGAMQKVNKTGEH